MCGICGFNWPEGKLIQDMLNRMRHRGPDNSDILSDEHMTLGHLRLSIIDLSPQGHQPMCNEDGKIWLVYNGEVYNFPVLRKDLEAEGHRFKSHTDSEVIIHAYEQWGVDCLRRFNGMFAFCIYDSVKKTLLLARDRFGIKPLYYSNEGEKLIFASEIPPLLCHMNAAPNRAMIRDFLLYNITDHTEETLFSQIKRLPKGHYMLYDLETNTPTMEQWWSLNQVEQPISYEEAKTKLTTLMTDSINIRLRSDVPVGTCLSGGIDSSTIAYMIDSTKKAEIKTFSAVFPGYRLDETRYIDLVSRQGIENRKVTPTAESFAADIMAFTAHQAEPIMSASPYSQYCVMRLAKESGVVVLLDGQGADELLGGYPYFWGFYLKGLILDLRFGRLAKELSSILSGDWIMKLSSLAFLFLPNKLRESYFRDKSNISWQLYDSESSNFQKRYYSCKGLREALTFHMDCKLEHLLKWEDRNSMAFSRESRIPFLDYRVVELIRSLPEDYLLKSPYTKRILRDSMAGKVPHEILTRLDKIGFETPQDEWLKTEAMRSLIREYLLCDRPRCAEYVNLKKTRTLIEEHNSGRRNHGRTLWKTLSLEIWLRTFIPQ